MQLPKQQNHKETINQKHDLDLILICDNLKIPQNIGMLFRVCEAFAINEIHLCGNETPEINQKTRKTSRNTHSLLNIKRETNTLTSVKAAKARGYTLIGLELTNTSKNLFEFDFKFFQKMALVIGSERNGISEQTLQQLHNFVEIPLFGKNSSINVVNATSIALYEIIKQKQFSENQFDFSIKIKK